MSDFFVIILSIGLIFFLWKENRRAQSSENIVYSCAVTYAIQTSLWKKKTMWKWLIKHLPSFCLTKLTWNKWNLWSLLVVAICRLKPIEIMAFQRVKSKRMFTVTVWNDWFFQNLPSHWISKQLNRKKRMAEPTAHNFN